MKKKKDNGIYRAFLVIASCIAASIAINYLIYPPSYKPKFIKGDCIAEDSMDYYGSKIKISCVFNDHIYNTTNPSNDFDKYSGTLDIKKTDERFHRVSCE